MYCSAQTVESMVADLRLVEFSRFRLLTFVFSSSFLRIVRIFPFLLWLIYAMSYFRFFASKCENAETRRDDQVGLRNYRGDTIRWPGCFRRCFWIWYKNTVQLSRHPGEHRPGTARRPNRHYLTNDYRLKPGRFMYRHRVVILLFSVGRSTWVCWTCCLNIFCNWQKWFCGFLGIHHKHSRRARLSTRIIIKANIVVVATIYDEGQHRGDRRIRSVWV
jgi:hypothetical protein